MGGREAGCVRVPHAPTALGLCGGMRCPGGVRSWPEAGDPYRGARARRPGVAAQRRAHFAAGADRGRCPDPAPRVHLRIFPSPQYMHPSPPNAPELVRALGRSWRPELETAPGRSRRVFFQDCREGRGSSQPGSRRAKTPGTEALALAGGGDSCAVPEDVNKSRTKFVSGSHGRPRGTSGQGTGGTEWGRGTPPRPWNRFSGVASELPGPAPGAVERRPGSVPPISPARRSPTGRRAHNELPSGAHDSGGIFRVWRRNQDPDRAPKRAPGSAFLSTAICGRLGPRCRGPSPRGLALPGAGAQGPAQSPAAEPRDPSCRDRGTP